MSVNRTIHMVQESMSIPETTLSPVLFDKFLIQAQRLELLSIGYSIVNVHHITLLDYVARTPSGKRKIPYRVHQRCVSPSANPNAAQTIWLTQHCQQSSPLTAALSHFIAQPANLGLAALGARLLTHWFWYHQVPAKWNDAHGLFAKNAENSVSLNKVKCDILIMPYSASRVRSEFALTDESHTRLSRVGVKANHSKYLHIDCPVSRTRVPIKTFEFEFDDEKARRSDDAMEEL
jgi:hypothetical protein